MPCNGACRAQKVWADSGIGPVVPVIQPAGEKAKEAPLVVLQHVSAVSEVAVQAKSPLAALCPTVRVSEGAPRSPEKQNRPDLSGVATR